MRYFTLASGAHTTLRLSGFPTLICVPLSLTVYSCVDGRLSLEGESAGSFLGRGGVSDETVAAMEMAPVVVIAAVGLFVSYPVCFVGLGNGLYRSKVIWSSLVVN